MNVIRKEIPKKVAEKGTELIPWKKIDYRLILGEGQDRIRYAAALAGYKDPDRVYFHIKDYWKGVVQPAQDLGLKGYDYWAETVQLNRKWVNHMAMYGVGFIDIGFDRAKNRSPYYQAELEELDELQIPLEPMPDDLIERANELAKKSSRPQTPKAVKDKIEQLKK